MSIVRGADRGLIAAAAVAGLLVPACALHAAPSTVDDRILLGANGESLTNTSGGGGGFIGWLHNFDADTLAGVGVEHQALANAHWTFGSLNGSYSIGQGDQRYSFYGEAHEGGGNSGARALNYHIEAVGVAGTYFHKLSVLIEDRQFYVDTVSGNLPKLGVSYLWNPHLQTGLSYSYSGEKTFAPGLRVKEGYVGATLPLPRIRSEVSLILDYQNLTSTFVDSNRFQGNLNYIFHLGHHGT
jgi:hypothetical protein